MQTYEEIFNQRGRSYHLAMEKYPNARKEEFLYSIDLLEQKSASTILDLPAGGSYLKPYLKKDTSYLPYDFSGEFEESHGAIKKCKESKIELPDNCVDEVISLAALHHISARKEFYSEMFRILKPQGKLVVGDVSAGGPIESFLNGFVDQWNSMGHQGNFISEDDVGQIEDAGFKVERIAKRLYWNFEDQASAFDFFRLLFFLDRQPSDRQLKDALEQLGIRKTQEFSVEWSLDFLICSR